MCNAHFAIFLLSVINSRSPGKEAESESIHQSKGKGAGSQVRLCSPAVAAAYLSVGVSWQGFPPLLLQAILKWRFLHHLTFAEHPSDQYSR